MWGKEHTKTRSKPMKKKRRLDNDEIDQDTVHKLVAAFKGACASYQKEITIPPEFEIEGTAMTILTLECNEGNMRKSGLHDLQEYNHCRDPKAARKVIYPDFDCCPVDQKEYSTDSSCVELFAEGKRPLSDALCTILRGTYRAWFDENCRIMR